MIRIKEWQATCGSCVICIVYILALEKGVYRIVGKMLGYMLVHRGPIPNFLDPFLYDVLSKGTEGVRAEIGNVGDYILKEQLEKVMNRKIGSLKSTGLFDRN